MRIVGTTSSAVTPRSIDTETTNSADTPASKDTAESEGGDGDNELDGLPWWEGGRREALANDRKGKGKASAYVPYHLETIVRPKRVWDGEDASCVEFYPFIGPRRPKATLGRKEWDLFDDAVAYVAGRKLVVGRCKQGASGEGVWKQLWEVKVDGEVRIPASRIRKTGDKEILYHVTWTINPFNLHPIVITAGMLGVVYVLDVMDRKLVRMFKGHGDEVQCLAICPTHPHILASGSRDHSVRIWNLYGHETIIPPGQRGSQNYPMGLADEGNHLFAILCGGWPGGNMDDVCGLAWHPSHRAIATIGRDHSFKVWAIPPIPSPVMKPPDIGYRPIHVSWPLFSTCRVSYMCLDSIAWLNEDILVAKTAKAIITFQWLGYRRYFERGKWDPLGDYDQVPDTGSWFDVDDSRSIMKISEIPLVGNNTYIRFGFHERFTPTPEELAKATQPSSTSMVQDYLVVAPQAGRSPQVVVFAPVQAPPAPVAALDLDHLRFDVEDWDDVEYDEQGREVEGVEEVVRKGKRKGKGKSKPGMGDKGMRMGEESRKGKVKGKGKERDQVENQGQGEAMEVEGQDGQIDSTATARSTREADAHGPSVTSNPTSVLNGRSAAQSNGTSGDAGGTPAQDDIEVYVHVSDPEDTDFQPRTSKGTVLSRTQSLRDGPTDTDRASETTSQHDRPTRLLRSAVSAMDISREASSVSGSGSGKGGQKRGAASAAFDGEGDGTRSSDLTEEENEDQDEDEEESDTDTDEEDFTHPHLRPKPYIHNLNYVWTLRATAQDAAVKKAPPAQNGTNELSVIQCCAVSPRGARWVIGVGHRDSVYIWKLKD